jgi:hypothetical protein
MAGKTLPRTSQGQRPDGSADHGPQYRERGNDVDHGYRDGDDGAVRCRHDQAVSLELKSSGKKGEWSKVTADAVENYIAWANFWSARKTCGDHTSEIVVRAVVHGHAFRVIERDVGIGTGRGAVICVRGLRDYAARSGWVARGIAAKWMDDALTSFKHARPLTELELALARARRLKEATAAT